MSGVMLSTAPRQRHGRLDNALIAQWLLFDDAGRACWPVSCGVRLRSGKVACI
jgi:hypothetical protein